MISQRETLAEQICQGNQEAFEQLFRKTFSRLYAFAFKIVKDEGIAQDMVQDLYLKVWEKRKELRPLNIEGFLFKLLRNQCISHLRHVQVVENRKQEFARHRAIEELYHIDFTGNQPLVLIEKELEEQVLHVMDSLPDRCREVFRLSRIEGLKNREIAEKLNINIKNVEKHISKALTTFRNQFKDQIPLVLIILILKNHL